MEDKMFPNSVVHVIKNIFTYDDHVKLSGNDLKLLILGYKSIGRGRDYASAHQWDDDGDWLYKAIQTKMLFLNYKVVSFDNLAIEQLAVSKILTKEQWDEFYMGDDSEFTFYLDLVHGYCAPNSLSNVHYPIGNKTIDECFQMVRHKGLWGYDLKPCPFCGGDAAMYDTGAGYQVTCNKCKVTSKLYKHAEDAETHWNDRQGVSG